MQILDVRVLLKNIYRWSLNTAVEPKLEQDFKLFWMDSNQSAGIERTVFPLLVLYVAF